MDNLKQQLVLASKSGELLSIARELYFSEKEERDNLSQALASLHNAGKINVITEFQKKHDFFMNRHILEGTLPLITEPVSNVMECVRYLTLEAGHDMAAGIIISPFIEFMSADERRPEEVLRIALNAVDEQLDFIAPALLAGTKLNLLKYLPQAIELSQHANAHIRIRATQALGRIQYNEKSNLVSDAVTAIEFTVSGNFDELLFASALRTSYSLYNQDSAIEHRVINILKVILKHHDDHILCIASEILFLETDIPKTIVDILLNALTHTKPINKGTLDNIDHGLERLIKRSETESVINFLEHILLDAREISITQFDSLCHAITSDSNILNAIITRWLLSKKVRLGRCAADLLPMGSERGIPLEADYQQLEGLTEDTYIFLARKACGWFFMHQISATSFILSLIDKIPEADHQEITKILFNPLLISFPGSVKEHLENALENASDRKASIINQAVEQFDEYHKGLKDAYSIKELQPSEAHKEMHYRRHARLMSESQEQADKHSIWRQITTMLLYGSKYIHYIKNGPEGQSTRQETPLQHFSYSIEFPLLDNLDHNGLEHMLRHFRLEGCSS